MAVGIELDYSQVTSANTTLDNIANEQVIPQITTLNTTVANLLAPDGGLYLENTSPALYTKWDEFHTALVNGVGEINTFIQQFNNIVTSMQQFDTQSATSISTSSS